MTTVISALPGSPFSSRPAAPYSLVRIVATASSPGVGTLGRYDTPMAGDRGGVLV